MVLGSNCVSRAMLRGSSWSLSRGGLTCTSFSSSVRVSRTRSLLPRRLRFRAVTRLTTLFLRSSRVANNWLLTIGKVAGILAAFPFLFKEGDVMRIAMYVHYYLSYHFAGSEIYVHELL